MNTPWNEREQFLFKNIRKDLNTREIVELFSKLGYNRTAKSISRMSEKLGIKFIDFGIPSNTEFTKDENEAIKEVIAKRTENIQFMEVSTEDTVGIKARKTKERNTIMHDLFEALNHIRISTPCKGSISPIRSCSLGKESLCVLLSDWHIGQRIIDQEDGMVLYDMNIALQRIKQTPEIIFKNLSNRELEKIDECVLLLCGDMITGEGIFQGQDITLHHHAIEQVKAAIAATWEMICTFSQQFKLVRIVTTKGNHGRTGGSPEANWDNMIYLGLSICIDASKSDKITIKNRYGDYNIVDIRGHKGMIRHYAPIQADTAAASARFGGWRDIHDYDWCAYGHFHHWGIFTYGGKPIFRNGSLSGGDDYAETLGKYDLPTQLCWGISDEEVCTFIRPIKYT